MHPWWAPADAIAGVVLGLLLAASVSTWAVLLSQAWRLRRVHHDLNLSKALFWQAPHWQQGLQVLQDTEKEGLLSRLAQAAQAPLAGTLAASASVPAQTERALRDALHLACARLHHGHTFLASVAACAPFVGLLGTVWGVRRTAFSGLWFALIGACLLPFAGSVPVVQRVAWLTLCALTGYTGLSLYFVNALPFLMQVTSLQNRANVFAAAAAVSTTAMVGGGLAGGVLPGLFASALGVTMASPEPYRWTLAVVPLFVVAALLVFMQTQEPAGHSEPDAVAVEAQSGGALQGAYGLILMLGLVRFLQVAALGGGLTFFNVYMDTALAVPTFWVGVALAGARLAAVPTALLGPAISRRLGLGNTVVFSSVLVAICVLPLALVPTPVAATLGMVGLLLFSNIRYPAFNIYMLDAVPVRMRPMMSGVNEMAAGASFALIALVGGLIIVRHGYSAAFLAGGAITLLGSFVFAVMLRRRN